MAAVYILYSEKIDRYYIGSCLDIETRLEQHQSKQFLDAFTRRSDDWKVHFQIDNLNQSLARNIENHIKNMKSKRYIQNLKAYPEIIDKLILQYKAGSSR
jgi:putative endonuclease